MIQKEKNQHYKLLVDKYNKENIMQSINKSTIESLLIEHLANAGYALAKVFGIEHELCANKFAPPMLGNCASSIFPSFWRCDFSRTQAKWQ